MLELNGVGRWESFDPYLSSNVYHTSPVWKTGDFFSLIVLLFLRKVMKYKQKEDSFSAFN